jgi:APA family basic amino acid/polyamine antiporter
VALNALFVYAAPVEELAGRADVGAVAAAALGGEWMANAVRALVAFASWTSISAMIMAGPRVYAKMAEDGLFPRVAGSFHGATTPRVAVGIQAALAIVVVWSSELANLLGYIGFTLGLCSAATVIALIVLRRREGPERVPVFGYPIVPGIYVVGTLGAAGFMACRRPGESLAALATIGLGAAIYFLTRRRRSGA